MVRHLSAKLVIVGSIPTQLFTYILGICVTNSLTLLNSRLCHLSNCHKDFLFGPVPWYDTSIINKKATAMKDFLGQKLEIGDSVALIMPNYRELTKGVITRFTRCYAYVAYNRYGNSKAVPDVTEIKQSSAQLAKITY